MNYYKLIFLFFSTFCFSQINSENKKLYEDNLSYFVQLNNEKTILKKLVLIEEKILRDSIYKVDSTWIKKRGYFDGNYIDSLGNKCGKKIAHYILYKKGELIFEIDPLNEKTMIFNELKSFDLEKIIIFENNKSQALFGSYASEGGVVIYTNDKKAKKLIKKLKK